MAITAFLVTTFALLVAILAGAVVGVIGMRWLRRVHWVGDLLAIGLPLVALGLLAVVVVAVTGHHPAVFIGGTAGLCLGCIAEIVVPRLGRPTGAPSAALVLAAVNLRYDGTDPDGGVRSAVDAHSDVLVVSELTQGTDLLLTAAFPNRFVTDESLAVRNNGVGVYARVPIELMAQPAGYDGIALRVRVLGAAPFVLYAAHLPRPVVRYDGSYGLDSMRGHRDKLEMLDAMARAEKGPVVIAGDLNMSDRASGYTTLSAGRHDALRGGWPGTTFFGGLLWRMLMLRIDHIFLPAGWAARGAGSFALAGSDHRGVRAEIGPGAPRRDQVSENSQNAA